MINRKKWFFIFSAILMIFLTSCENENVPVISETDFEETSETTEFAEFTGDIPDIPEETEEDTDEVSEDDETPASEPLYNALYTVDEIKEIFDTDKELFEKVKDMKMPNGYNYFTAYKYQNKIEFYNFEGKENDRDNFVSYDIGDINENGGFDPITEIFNKYEHIFFIHSINPESEIYLEENLVSMFGFQVDTPDNEVDCISWAEIRYNRNSGEIQEKTTGKYMIIPLDDHWYYIYSNIIQN